MKPYNCAAIRLGDRMTKDRDGGCIDIPVSDCRRSAVLCGFVRFQKPRLGHYSFTASILFSAKVPVRPPACVATGRRILLVGEAGRRNSGSLRAWRSKPWFDVMHVRGLE